MALVNHAKKEINAKLVYYGPQGCGKGAALHYIYSRIKTSLRGDLKTVPAGGDNLLFFDFSPFDAPLADGYRLRLHVYTLTGQVTNPATWRMTLKGADGLVIMLDPVSGNLAPARESVSDLRDLLSAYGVGLQDIPVVLQLNYSGPRPPDHDVTQIALQLELPNVRSFYSSAASGEGILDVLGALSRLVLERVVAADSRLTNASGDSVPGAQVVEPSTELPEIVAEMAESPALPDAMPNAGLAEDDFPALSVESHAVTLDADGRTMRIPIDLFCGGVSRKLLIKVTVDSL